MNPLLHDYVMPMIRQHGVLTLGCVTLVESMGVPAPGESAVIAAAIYAATTHQIGILPLVAAAAVGAILGETLGYLVGRRIGFPLMAHYGRRIGLTEARIRLGRYLFDGHGSKVVFFGRFFALLRTFTAILAGANRMAWHKFMAANILGGVVWAAVYGFGAYILGREATRLEAPLAIAGGCVAALVIGTSIVVLRRHEARLQGEAERAYAGGMVRPAG
jgi:membrane protein DedA with SNARE-associated domain